MGVAHRYAGRHGRHLLLVGRYEKAYEVREMRNNTKWMPGKLIDMSRAFVDGTMFSLPMLPVRISYAQAEKQGLHQDILVVITTLLSYCRTARPAPAPTPHHHLLGSYLNG